MASRPVMTLSVVPCACFVFWGQHLCINQRMTLTSKASGTCKQLEWPWQAEQPVTSSLPASSSVCTVQLLAPSFCILTAKCKGVSPSRFSGRSTSVFSKSRRSCSRIGVSFHGFHCSQSDTLTSSTSGDGALVLIKRWTTALCVMLVDE